MSADMSADFTPEQKRYLEGLASGVALARAAAPPATSGEAAGPEAAHRAAQDRAVAAGGRLVDQEKWKRAEHPFDAYARLVREATGGRTPPPEDNFRWRHRFLAQDGGQQFGQVAPGIEHGDDYGNCGSIQVRHIAPYRICRPSAAPVF